MAIEPITTDRAHYSVRRSGRARRSRLIIADDGAAVVVLPIRSPDREAAELVARHRSWIARHRASLAERRIRLATRPLLAVGRFLAVNGATQLIRATTAAERSALEGRLRREAWRVISERVAIRATEIGVVVRRISIRDQRPRWGSASQRSGTLSFNWRLVMCPLEILDYVVVHELGHLRIAGHSAAFWRLVDRYVADSGAARRWLRDNHHEIRHALD